MKAMCRLSIVSAEKAEKKKRDASETGDGEWFKSLEPKLLKIGAVTLGRRRRPAKAPA